MHDVSTRGVEVLRVLAVSVRSDQDYGLTVKDITPVGALKSNSTQAEVLTTIKDYRPPYHQLAGSRPIGLREALNKIVHADPSRAGYFADNDTHDLVLSGVNLNQRDTWIAVVSLIDICRVIQSLPDAVTLSKGER
jgi:hypothetical protein